MPRKIGHSGGYHKCYTQVVSTSQTASRRAFNAVVTLRGKRGLPFTKHRQSKLNLAALHAVCEANYARFMSLFPDYEASNKREFSVGTAHVSLEVTGRSRYTTMFCLHQRHAGDRWLGSLRIELRAYHDAGMLEVGSFQSHRRIQPRYAYPNPHMFQQDEKVQQNRFLADWLEYCLANGRSSGNPCTRA